MAVDHTDAGAQPSLSQPSLQAADVPAAVSEAADEQGNPLASLLGYRQVYSTTASTFISGHLHLATAHQATINLACDFRLFLHAAMMMGLALKLAMKKLTRQLQRLGLTRLHQKMVTAAWTLRCACVCVQLIYITKAVLEGC